MSGFRRASLTPTYRTPVGLLVLAGSALLVGCETPPKSGRITYECERGPRVTVIFEGDRARLILPSGTSVMQRRRSRTGFWFESPTHAIRGRGRRLDYTVGRMAPIRCTALSSSF